MPASPLVRSQSAAIDAYNESVRTGNREAAKLRLGDLIDLTLQWGSGVMSDADFHGVLSAIDDDG